MRLYLPVRNPARFIAVFTIIVFVLYGLVITIFPLLPFWIDEWMLLDNIKFKTPAQLWGILAHTQQFPRVYLQLVKYFSAACDYSYFSLRLPSFIVHCCGIALLYRLSDRIFRQDNLSRFLWMLIYISFNTSIHYFVQVKQYTMEMALSLVAIWQLLTLLRAEKEQLPASVLVLLFLSFGLCTFFSYTYPIVLAPVYVIVVLRMLQQRRAKPATILALAAGIAAVGIFYRLDVQQVLADPGMQDFWKDLLMKTFSWNVFFTNSYAMFCNPGTGDLFGHIFGVLGVAAFVYGHYVTARKLFSSHHEAELLVCYSTLLIWIVLGLFIAGKLPLGTFRLSSFVVAADGFLIIYMLLQLKKLPALKQAATVGLWGLFLAAAGTVWVTIAELATPEHAKKIRIYNTCDEALRKARREKLPILVTPGIAYPFDDRWPGDWILKTHPQYKTYEPLEVYPVPHADSAVHYLSLIHAQRGTAIVLDGNKYHLLYFNKQ
jgi:hypothetical protein